MHNLKSGQALIMLVLIIALLMTIVAATSFRLTTEVQSSKLQAESVRALAAADAGIEVGLQLAANTANIAPSQFAFEDVSINIPGIDVNRSKVIITPDSDTVFTSHQISKDEQLTFYLKEYPNYPGDYDGRLTVLFGSKAGDVCGSDLGGRTTPAIEVTYLTGVAPNEVKREIIEPCGRPGTFRIGGTGHVSATAISTIIDNVTYNYQATISGF
ncbi:MAG: pilus assembly PilX N-terminal domain-containing protein, partial [bacterium]|nr:pilus assembly PilX N-terminal domain-containing protein [bacterium]